MRDFPVVCMITKMMPLESLRDSFITSLSGKDPVGSLKRPFRGPLRGHFREPLRPPEELLQSC